MPIFAFFLSSALLLCVAAANIAAVRFLEELLAGLHLVWPEPPGAPVSGALIVASIIVAAIGYVCFRLLDRAQRRLSQGTTDGLVLVRDGSAPPSSLTQALVSALRTAFLCIAVPAAMLGLTVLVFLPALLWWSAEHQSEAVRLLGTLGWPLLAILGLGWLLELLHCRAAVRSMQERSGELGGSGDDEAAAPKSRRDPPALRLYDRGDAEPPSPAAAKLLQAARRYRRWAWLRDFAAPLVLPAAVGATGWLVFSDLAGSSLWSWLSGLAVCWAVLLAGVGLVRGLHLADRSPLRQLRLGLGALLAAPLLSLAVPLRLPGLLRHSGRPSRQWLLLGWPGRWASRLLRSPRLLWYCAALVVPATSWAWSVEPPTDEATVRLLLCTLVGLGAYEIAARWCASRLERVSDGRCDLVFLRVFGDRRRGRFLFEQVLPRWLGIGGVTCIAAPDVSIHQLQPDQGLDALFGQVQRRFIGARDEPGAVGRHLLFGADELGTVREWHCFDDTWRQVMQALLAQNTVVSMDLRGFGPQNRGCIHELGVLRDRVPMQAVVFLVEQAAEADFLRDTLAELWGSMDSHSPNAGGGDGQSGEPGAIAVFVLSSPPSASARALVTRLCEACAAGEAYNRQAGQPLLEGVLKSLQLLAASAEQQARAVADAPLPGEKVLEAGHRLDPDLDGPGYLLAWGLITDARHSALLEVHDAVQTVRHGGSQKTVEAMADDPAWQALRDAARRALKCF
jgi:hypothetical protein